MYTNNINIVAVGLALQCSSVSTRSPHPAALNQASDGRGNIYLTLKETPASKH